MSSPTLLDSITSNLLILILSKMQWEDINKTRRTCRWLCEFIEENKGQIQIPVGFKDIFFISGSNCFSITLPERGKRIISKPQVLYGYRTTGSLIISGLEEYQVEPMRKLFRNFKFHDVVFDMVSQELIEAVLVNQQPREIRIQVFYFAGVKDYCEDEDEEHIPYDKNLTTQPALQAAKILHLDGCTALDSGIFKPGKVIFFQNSMQIPVINGILKDFVRGKAQPCKIVANLMNFKQEKLFLGLNYTLHWSEETHSSSKLSHIPREELFLKVNKKRRPLEPQLLYSLPLPAGGILAVSMTKSKTSLSIKAYKSTKKMLTSFRRKGQLVG